MAETNPNGANQYQVDPRQIDFLKYYLDPKEKDTFSNAVRAGMKAGYTKEYSENILSLMPDWLSESIEKRKRILYKAEARGEKLIDSEDERVAADMVKHFTKTLGKEHYSERTEMTGKDGEALNKPIDPQEFNTILSQYAIRRKQEDSSS